MAFNSANLTKVSPANVAGPSFFLYNTKTDNIAAVSVATYFTPFADSLLQSLLPNPFNVGDSIQCTCTDGLVDLKVTSIDPIATAPEAVTVVIGPNSVNTAAIQNLAVTTGKIDNLAVTAAKIANNTITATQIANATITTTQISGAAAITGAQLAAGANIAGSQLAAAAGIVGTQLAANTIDSSRLNLNTLQYVKVPVTAVQFAAAYATPFVLIAAPGAGLAIIVESAVFAMTFNSVQYANGGALGLQYDTTAHLAGVAASGTVAAATINGFAASSAVGVAGTVAAGASTAIAEKGIYLSNDTGAFDTGDSAFNVHIWYRVVTLL